MAKPMIRSERYEPISLEFVGLPGSGKTSAELLLTKELASRALQVHSFRDFAEYFRKPPLLTGARLSGIRELKRLGLSFDEVKRLNVKDPELSGPLRIYRNNVLRIIESGGLSGLAIRNSLLWLDSELKAFHAWNTRANSNSPGRVLIADEAFTHRSTALFAAGEFNQESLRLNLELRPKFTFVVFLPVGLKESRLRKDGPAFQDESMRHKTGDILERQLEVVRSFQQLLPQEQMIIVNNGASTSEVVHDIVKRIEAHTA